MVESRFSPSCGLLERRESTQRLALKSGKKPEIDRKLFVNVPIMPTVLRKDGFDVMIYTQDHFPAHVHVWKAGKQIIIDLGSDQEAPSVRENVSMSKANGRRALRIVEENQSLLLDGWRQIHG